MRKISDEANDQKYKKKVRQIEGAIKFYKINDQILQSAQEGFYEVEIPIPSNMGGLQYLRDTYNCSFSDIAEYYCERGFVGSQILYNTNKLLISWEEG